MSPLKAKSFGEFAANSIKILLEYSAFLMVGALIGLVWANLAHQSYDNTKGAIEFVINDIAMAFFFLLAGKEIREAMLPGGALSSARTAALPVMATIGGMAGPALFYVAGTQIFACHDKLIGGWAIPMATDIAFSYLVARLVFPRIGGKPHPAIVFLLLLAIADDAGGLLVLAIFYQQEVHTFVLPEASKLFFFGGLILSILLAQFMWHKGKITSFWPYLLGPGGIAWIAFHDGGIHPALALVPLAWCMPHEHTDLGIWDMGESHGQDTLNKMEHWWKNPVEIILGFFGFVNAGVRFSAQGPGTWFVFCGLLFGKPIGIILFTKLGQLLGLQLPRGMYNRDLLVVGLAAGIGFTVALFVSVVAFNVGKPPDPVIQGLQDSVKMGALFSFAVAPITLIVAKMVGAGRDEESQK